MELRSLEIVFENCEVIKIDPEKHTITFNANKITEDIIFNGVDTVKRQVAEMVQLTLEYSCLELFSQMNTSLYKKLLHRDITSIVLVYGDESEDQIYVPWDYDQQNSDFENSFQKTEFLDSCILVNINRQG